MKLSGHNANRFTLLLVAIAAVPKSLYVSCRVCGFRRGIRLPIIVSPFTTLRHINARTVKVDVPKEQLRTGVIRIGFGNGPEGILASKRSYFGTDGNSLIVFKGSCSFSRGCTLKAIHGGVLTIGNGCNCNPGTYVLCSYRITIGEDFLTGWDCVLKDNDGHPIIRIGAGPNRENLIAEERKPIEVGDHVWLGAKVTLLKGAYVGPGSVVGWGSIVTKRFEESGQLIVGGPARTIRTGIEWNH